jgi:hypothetical protein
MARWSGWRGISGNRTGTKPSAFSFAANRVGKEGRMAKYKHDIFGIGALVAISVVGVLAFGL